MCAAPSSCRAAPSPPPCCARSSSPRRGSAWTTPKSRRTDFFARAALKEADPGAYSSPMHDLPLLTTIAAALAAAWVLGLLTQRLRLSPIVGYLLAGVVVGPYTPGFIADENIAHQLAEIGVILMMFGVGLHFHPKDLLAVKNVAIPGAVVQSAVATVLAVVAFYYLFDWPIRSGVVIGMAMAVASTVVLLRVLTDREMVATTHGHVAVGWLIVEDI